MARFMVKANMDQLPPGPAGGWEGHVMTLVDKIGPRRVFDLSSGHWDARRRLATTQVEAGDEVWICTDDKGPGIAAVAEVGGVDRAGRSLRLRLGAVTEIPEPVALSRIDRNDSGSDVLGRLKKSRHPDIYVMDEEEFDAFERVLRETGGIRSLPERMDWADVLERNRDAIRTIRDKRVGDRPAGDAFRARLMRYYDGRCVVTGCTIGRILDGAHIVPWTGDPDLERPENGLLLRKDIHGLFDADLLRIVPNDGCVELADSVIHSEYASLQGRQVPHRAACELLEERYAIAQAALQDGGRVA